jgi:N,N'-diacetyllegionaminate synthase
MKDFIKIAGRSIGEDYPPFIIAEVAQSHDGSLGTACSFIDAAAECGADAIKFQTHIASEESTRREPWRVSFSKQDSSRYDYWERMAFSKEEWRYLKERADEKGLIFLSSPFSIMACDWLEDLGMAAWKIASGEVYNEELLARIERTGQPIILSSGLSNFSLSERLIDRFNAKNIDVALLHCTTIYPTPPAQIGLNILEAFHQRFSGKAITGLSDHSGTPFPGILAVYGGASIIEAHITLHPLMFGPDVPASLNLEEFKTLVEGVHFSWKMRQSNIDKDFQLNGLTHESAIFTRSLVASHDLSSGHKITSEDLAYKKPGGGLKYEYRSKFIGKKIKVDVPFDTLFDLDMIQEYEE